MTIRYVNWEKADDTGDGLSYANAKKTINGVIDTPIVAGDTVYIRPGTYKEEVVCDVTGTAGNIITFIGDVTGEHTDGVGGIVRITGSDNDTTTTRNYGFNCDGSSYLTFRGLTFDMFVVSGIYFNDTTHSIVEDCNFNSFPPNGWGLYAYDVCTSNTIRRCTFIMCFGAVKLEALAQIVTSANLIENCLFVGARVALYSDYIDGVTVKDCAIIGSAFFGIYAMTATGATQFTVNNCILASCDTGFQAANVNQIIENYNSLFNNESDRVNTNTGANSNTYPPLFNPPILLATMKYPHDLFALAPYSPLRGITGTGESTDDFYGMARPATAAKNSWGAIQYTDISRETTTKRTGTASMKFEDAGRHQIFVPTSNVETTIGVYVYWEADYTGTKPQMIIRQPGVAARTTVATGAAEAWELLTDTFTPAASPPYVIVELVSNNTNTASAATNDVFFDDLVVQ